MPPSIADCQVSSLSLSLPLSLCQQGIKVSTLMPVIYELLENSHEMALAWADSNG